MTRRELSKCHSISIGFDLKPRGRPSFPFRALTYYADGPAHRFAMLTLFPIGAAMRANLFVYRDLHDPWLQQLRAEPERILTEAMPQLRIFAGDFTVPGFVQIRPADLYRTEDVRRAGVVLVGDAYATSCPAAGTGTGKVFTDVERLCNVYIPRWLATPGMGADKIGAFYDDPAKVAYDTHSIAKAYSLRTFSLGTDLSAKARRGLKFVLHLGLGTARHWRRQLLHEAPSDRSAAAPAFPAIGERATKGEHAAG
jgi:hypothetical protein